MIVIFGALCLVMAFGATAMAQTDPPPATDGAVEVTATIDKLKSKLVVEDVLISKAVEIGVKQIVKPSSSAEAQAVKNDTSVGNIVTELETPGVPPIPAVPPTYEINPITGELIEIDPGLPAVPGVPPVPVVKAAVIDAGSLDGAAGIINVNQAPGNINNQGNAVALSYSAPAFAVTEVAPGTEGETRFVGGAFLHAESSAEKELAANAVTSFASLRSDTINAALVGATGIIGINQSAGNINNQNNATSLALGDGIAALTEADLGLHSTANTAADTGTSYNDSLTGGALGTAAGIINVNQASGSMNNQANVVAVGVLTGSGLAP
jgi:hypothetical protein